MLFQKQSINNERCVGRTGKLCGLEFYQTGNLPDTALALQVVTSARLAHPHPHSAQQQSACNREALLLERFKGHTAAVTAVLVTSDAGDICSLPSSCSTVCPTSLNLLSDRVTAMHKFSLLLTHRSCKCTSCPYAGRLVSFLKSHDRAEQSKEFVTSSLDKSVALWQLPVRLWRRSLETH